MGQTRQRVKQLGLPQIGVAVGGKAIQIKRIHPGLHLRQTVVRLAQHQSQLHPASVERDAVEAWRQRRPVRQQFARAIGELRPLRMQPCQIICRERMLLDRQKMQPRRALRVDAPCRPGHQKIQTGTKSGFQDDKPGAIRPRLRQTAALQEHMMRLSHTTVGRMIDIVIQAGIGNAIPEFEAGGNNGFQHGRMVHWPDSLPFPY